MNLDTPWMDGDQSPVASRRVTESALSGKRIVVTRAAHQAPRMADSLRAFGAFPVSYPCIDIVPPEDTGPLDDALCAAAMGEFDWLVLTSANTVEAIAGRLEILGYSLGSSRVAAIGAKTAAAARERLHLEPDLVAGVFDAEALADALDKALADATGLMHGVPILLPQSDIARPLLADRLSAKGASVTAVVAYRTVMGQGGDDLPSMLALKQIDAITFTSGSTVTYFLERLDREGADLDDLEGVCLAAIGPVTAGAIRSYDLPVAVMPSEYTVPTLINALEEYFLRAPSPQLPDQGNE